MSRKFKYQNNYYFTIIELGFLTRKTSLLAIPPIPLTRYLQQVKRIS